jgi:hypothetical protein
MLFCFGVKIFFRQRFSFIRQKFSVIHQKNEAKAIFFQNNRNPTDMVKIFRLGIRHNHKQKNVVSIV